MSGGGSNSSSSSSSSLASSSRSASTSSTISKSTPEIKERFEDDEKYEITENPVEGRGAVRLAQKDVLAFLLNKDKKDKTFKVDEKDKITEALISTQLNTKEISIIKSHFKNTGELHFRSATKADVKTLVIENSIELFKYLGFDAIQTRLLVEDKEKIKEIFCDEITAISTLILTRGTVFNKVLRRTASKSIDIGQFLTRKYGYRKNNNRGTNNMTLSRHSHVFPDFCALVLAQNLKIRILGTIPTGFPRFLCFPGSMALVDYGRKEKYMDLYIEWNLSFSKTIKSNQDREIVKKFAELSYSSPIFSDEVRKTLITELTQVSSETAIAAEEGR